MAKAFARKFYDSMAWRNTREAYAVSVHHLCERCLSKGILKPGEIVHHKIELTPENIDDPRISLSFDNLEMVCRDCHAELHHAEEGWSALNEKKRQAKAANERFVVGENGKIFPHDSPLH